MASPDCDCAVLLVRNRGEISRSGNAGVSQCAPAPNGGQGWRKEGDHHLKRGFLQSNFFYFERHPRDNSAFFHCEICFNFFPVGIQIHEAVPHPATGAGAAGIPS
jgi:hypothetical protein